MKERTREVIKILGLVLLLCFLLVSILVLLRYFEQSQYSDYKKFCEKQGGTFRSKSIGLFSEEPQCIKEISIYEMVRVDKEFKLLKIGELQ